MSRLDEMRHHRFLFTLQESFGVPVLDRYNVVLQIFQKHSRTKEAKLQVSLAEIQYLMLRLNEDWAVESVNKHSKGRLGEDHFEKQDMLLKRRKAKIIKSVRNQPPFATFLPKFKPKYDLLISSSLKW